MAKSSGQANIEINQDGVSITDGKISVTINDESISVSKEVRKGLDITFKNYDKSKIDSEDVFGLGKRGRYEVPPISWTPIVQSYQAW